MLSKRFFLIAGGTVTGLGVVLSITPPQFGTTTGLALGTTTTTPPLPVPTPTPTPTPKSTPTPVKAPPTSGVSGTFTGATASTIYGPVQVQITVAGGKITNAVALSYPTRDFRSQQINQQAIPYLIQETLAAQSTNIQGVSGASYTSQGWFTSLTSALAKAGM